MEVRKKDIYLFGLSERQFKIVVSLIFGVAGLLLNFFDVELIHSREIKISFLPGLIFPLLISLAWGWRYGLLSALAGGCQTMWWSWSENGYALLYAVPVYTLWVVWHGFWSDFRKKNRGGKWHHSAFLQELTFRAVSEAGYLTVFKWLLAQNPPFWNSAATNTVVHQGFFAAAVPKHIFSGLFLLLAAIAILGFPWVKRFFGFKGNGEKKISYKILYAAVLAGILLFISGSFINYALFNNPHLSFGEILFLNFDNAGGVLRHIYLLGALGFGLWLAQLFESRISIEKKYSTLVEKSRDAIITINHELKITEWNRGAEKMFGFSAIEMKNRCISSLLPHESAQEFKSRICRYFESGKTADFEARLLDRRQHYVDGDISLSCQTMEPEGEKIIFLIIRDMGERKKHEAQRKKDIAELRERNKEMQCLIGIERLTSMSEQDTDEILQYICTMLPESCQYPAITECRISLEDRTFCSEKFDVSAIGCSAEIAVGQKKFGVIEMYLLSGVARKTGISFLAEEKTLLQTVGWRLGRFLQGQKSLASLRESEELFRVAFEGSPLGIFMMDLGFCILRANQPFCKLSGYSECELAGRSLEKIVAESERDSLQKHKRSIKSGITESFMQETDFLNKNGSSVSGLLSISLILNDRGKPGYMLGHVMDITEKKQAMADRKKLQEKMVMAQKVEAIGRLAGGVAHDLNNLLSPVIGYSEMLIDSDDGDLPCREELNEILQAGLKARELIRQLMAYGRKQPLEICPVNMNRALKEISPFVKKSMREDIEITLELDPELWITRLDKNQMDQVVINLVLNARDAMPEGGGIVISTENCSIDEIQADTYPDMEPGDYVCLEVCDNGTGMNEETRKRIFDPFFTTKPKGHGSGMGLASTYGIIKQHNGYIYVDSETNVGTEFKIYFPRFTDVPEIKTIVEVEKDHSENETPVGKMETILLVENDRMVGNMCRLMLQKTGYNVILFNDAQPALKMFRETKKAVDLLITDVVMPKMGGIELFLQMQKKEPALKVLYMSGYSDELVAARGVDRSNFIQKPFNRRDLACKIDNLLKRNVICDLSF